MRTFRDFVEGVKLGEAKGQPQLVAWWHNQAGKYCSQTWVSAVQIDHFNHQGDFTSWDERMVRFWKTIAPFLLTGEGEQPSDIIAWAKGVGKFQKE
uniref:Uncharacterized protein n=1 Tax=viral metagenome TaxID=1070528 RepID=A0A6M3LRQ7_9ZZZZ